MNDAKEGRNEGSLVETGVYITLINLFVLCIFCSVSRVSFSSCSGGEELRWKNAFTVFLFGIF